MIVIEFIAHAAKVSGAKNSVELVQEKIAEPLGLVGRINLGTFSQYPYLHAKERYREVARFVGIQGANDDKIFENFPAG